MKVIAVELDRDIAAHTGDQLVEAQLDRLAELVEIADEASERAFHFTNKLIFRQIGIGPFVARLQDDISVRSIGGHWIAGDFGRARP